MRYHYDGLLDYVSWQGAILKASGAAILRTPGQGPIKDSSFNDSKNPKDYAQRLMPRASPLSNRHTQMK